MRTRFDLIKQVRSSLKYAANPRACDSIEPPFMNPTTGIAVCCARAASGHAAAALPSSMMNSRMGAPPQA
jgi:hypothetical protein